MLTGSLCTALPTYSSECVSLRFWQSLATYIRKHTQIVSIAYRVPFYVRPIYLLPAADSTEFTV